VKVRCRIPRRGGDFVHRRAVEALPVPVEHIGGSTYHLRVIPSRMGPPKISGQVAIIRGRRTLCRPVQRHLRIPGRLPGSIRTGSERARGHLHPFPYPIDALLNGGSRCEGQQQKEYSNCLTADQPKAIRKLDHDNTDPWGTARSVM